MVREIIIHERRSTGDWVFAVFLAVFCLGLTAWFLWRQRRVIPKMLAYVRSGWASSVGSDPLERLVYRMFGVAATAGILALYLTPAVLCAYLSYRVLTPRVQAFEFGEHAVTLRSEWPASDRLIRYSEIREVGLYTRSRRFRQSLVVRVHTSSNEEFEASAASRDDQIREVHRQLRQRAGLEAEGLAARPSLTSRPTVP